MISSFSSAALFIDEEKKVIAPQNGKKSTAVFGAIAPRLHIIEEYASFVNMVQSLFLHLIRTDFFFNKFTTIGTQSRLPGA